jgi:hypothetical protein
MSSVMNAISTLQLLTHSPALADEGIGADRCQPRIRDDGHSQPA